MIGLAVGLGGGIGACFDGQSALGLPCRVDDDCGLGQRCDQGFCGGPPATSSDTELTTGSSTAADSTSGQSSSTSSPPGCGNGVIDDGEDCDPGGAQDEAECDFDCTAVQCNDGHLNEAAGELCDDGNESSLDDCTTECIPTLFWDDMEDPGVSMTKWTQETPTYTFIDEMMVRQEFSLDEGWIYGVPQPGTWGSGPYSDTSGTARLITQPMTFPELPEGDYRYEVRFRHRYRFDGNAMDIEGTACRDSFSSDGGLLWLLQGPMMLPVGMPVDYPELIEDNGCALNPNQPNNPLLEADMPRPGFSRLSPIALTQEAIALPDGLAGETVRLAFEIGYDCTNCWGSSPVGAGWTIDDVVVAAFSF